MLCKPLGSYICVTIPRTQNPRICYQHFPKNFVCVFEWIGRIYSRKSSDDRAGSTRLLQIEHRQARGNHLFTDLTNTFDPTSGVSNAPEQLQSACEALRPSQDLQHGACLGDLGVANRVPKFVGHLFTSHVFVWVRECSLSKARSIAIGACGQQPRGCAILKRKNTGLKSAWTSVLIQSRIAFCIRN